MVWALIFCTGKRTPIKKILFVGICFVQLFLICAYRFRIGSDYSMYAAGFFSMVRSGFSSLTYEDWEIGYVLLNKIVGLFTAQPGDFIVVTSLLSLIGPAYVIVRYSKNAFISVFLYVNFYLLYLDMNYIRQAIAMSILCFAYGFLKDKKFWRFLLIVAVAACFHMTVVYMVLVYLVCLTGVNTRTLILYLFALLFYYILSDGVLNIVLSRFHTEYSGSIFIESGVYYYYAVYPLLICAAMVALSYFVKDKSRTLNVLMHMTLLMGFWQIVMTKHALFERFSYYTMLFVILAVPEAVKAFKDQLKTNLTLKYTSPVSDDSDGSYDSHDSEQKAGKSRAAERKAVRKTNRAAAAVTVIVLVTAFIYNMMGLILPENGVHGVLPYQTRTGIEIPSIDDFFKS